MGLRVRHIQTATGARVGLGSFNVLVGPNNCGKSQTLRDIRGYASSGDTSRLTILKEIELSLPSESEGMTSIRVLPHPNPGTVRYLGVDSDLLNRQEFGVHETWLSEQFKVQNKNTVSALLKALGKFWVAHLDAESRLRLASPTECYDTRTETPSNALQAFFAGGESTLENLRTAFRDAFRPAQRGRSHSF